ncbi:MAG: iron ABC transporter permease [Actinomycetia bacterium]|nr:iron ABC transporter permease [Actinomycetes bacterium]
MSTRHTTSWFIGAVVVLIGAVALSLTVGAFTISLGDTMSWILGRLPDNALAGRVLEGVRLPRSLSAVVVGAALGVAGTTLQGLHRTPVIDAHLIGMSAASGLGVAVGYAFAPHDLKVLAAVLLGVAVGAVYGVMSTRIGRPGGGATVLVLTGLATGLAMTAWTGLFVLAIDSPAVPTLSFFIFGSLATSGWTGLLIATAFVLTAVGILWWMAPGIDLLSLGEQVSIHLGLDARRRVPMALAAVGVSVGASVALGGVIGFIGLIVPLAIRPMLGVTHRVMIPASAIAGAIAVVLFDTAARTLVAPIEIPIGLLTAAIGGPTLVWLIARERAT